MRLLQAAGPVCARELRRGISAHPKAGATAVYLAVAIPPKTAPRFHLEEIVAPSGLPSWKPSCANNEAAHTSHG